MAISGLTFPLYQSDSVMTEPVPTPLTVRRSAPIFPPDGTFTTIRRFPRIAGKAAGRLSRGRRGGSWPETGSAGRYFGTARRAAASAARHAEPADVHAVPAAAAGEIGRRQRAARSSPITNRAGDQPQAIVELVEGVRQVERDQVLLGVTGSGKTFTMAHVIEQTQRPALVLAPNKTLAAQLYGEFASFFPDNCGRVFRLLLRLLPAGSLCAAHRHLYREGILDQRADRPHAPFGDARVARARRCDRRRLGVLHLRHRRCRDLFGDDLLGEERASASRSASSSPISWRCTTAQ